MNISLDVTDFPSLSIMDVNYSLNTAQLNPIIFFDDPIQFDEIINFEIMNFCLEITDKMKESFVAKAPYFNDILTSKFKYADLMIYGRAKVCITKVKGLYLRLSEPSKYIPEDYYIKNVVPKVIAGNTIYYEAPCKLKKGDYLFACEGKSSFSNHYMIIYIIATGETKATLTFSSSDYVLVESDSFHFSLDANSEKELLKNQTPHICGIKSTALLDNCSTRIPEIFNSDYANKYFTKSYEKTGISSRSGVVCRDEE